MDEEKVYLPLTLALSPKGAREIKGNPVARYGESTG